MNLLQEEKIIKYIINGIDAYFYKNLALEERSNKNITLSAVSINPNNFYFTSDDLKNNRDFVLEAIKKGGSDILEYISDDLKNDSVFFTKNNSDI